LPKLDRKDALWLALLALLVVFYFRPFVFEGKIPLNADWLHANFHPGNVYLPGVKAHNSELDDPIYQFYPLRLEAVRQWKSLAVPLWNPYILCGTPLLADGISKPFDPFIALWLVFGGPVGHALELLAQYLLMITGMYILARSLGIARIGAATAAVIYTFNLLSVTWMELRTPTAAFAFFPWAFLWLSAALDTRSLKHAALAGLMAGLMVLSGHAQFVFYGFAVLALLVGWRTIVEWRSNGLRRALRTASAGCLGLAIGCALAAVEVLPFVEFISQSGRNPRQYEISNLSSTPLSFITCFYPNIFGNPASGPYLGGIVLSRPYMTATAGFVGISTLALMAPALFLAKFRHKGFLTCLWLGVFGLLVLMSVGLGQAVSHLTFFLSGMDMTRAFFVSNFALALSAGAGAAALAQADWKDRHFHRMVVTMLLAVAILIALTAGLRWAGPSLALRDDVQVDGIRWAVSEIERVAGSIFLWPPVYARLNFLAMALAVCLLAPWLRSVTAALAFLVIGSELMLSAFDYNPYVNASLIAPRFPFISAITCPVSDCRILGLDPPHPSELARIKGDCLVPNTAMLYGLADVRGDESLRLRRYQNYILRIVGFDANILASIHIPYANSPLVDAMNVRHILASAPISTDGLRTVFADGKSFVYQNDQALPRAYLAGVYDSADSPTDALNEIFDEAAFDFRRKVVLEPGGLAVGDFQNPFPGGDARIVDYRPARVLIRTSCASRAILVLSDCYYPGWSARVDGIDTTVIPANGTFRAVILPAGNHEVEFQFVPRSFAVGASISAAAALVILTLVSWPRREHRTDTPDAGPTA
jgi:hypothetical protein